MLEAKRDKCCCDSCGMAGLAPKLHFESMKPISTAGHKRRAAAYRITDDLLVELKRSLREERDKHLHSHPSYIMFRPDSVCADSLIDYIMCTGQVKDDFDVFFSPWHELQPTFFRVIQDVLSCVAIPRKSQHVVR